MKEQLKKLLVVALIICAGILSKENPLLGLSNRLDSYSQDLFNIGAGYLPQWLSQKLYPLTGQREISVLLLTDETVDGFFSGKWPISYDAHGRILNALSRYNPKAVVIDFLWLNSEKPGAKRLVKKLEKFKKKKIPVYLTFRKPAELINFWPELKGLVIPVSPKVTVDPTDFIARNYTITSQDLPYPAVKAYQDLYMSDFSSEKVPDMQIFWGVGNNPRNDAWMDQGDGRETVMDFIKDGISAHRDSPPYTTTVLVRDLLNPTAETEEKAHEDLRAHLEDKVVFYGAQVTGASDVIYTPKRQLRAGVYYHAMALDNLVTLKGDYKSDKLKGIFKDRPWFYGILLHIVILIVPSGIIYKRHGQNRAEQNPKKTADTEACSPIKKILLRIRRFFWDFVRYRLPLYGYIIFCSILCFWRLELAPRHWAGYIVFAEISFYIDNIIRFETAKKWMEENRHV